MKHKWLRYLTAPVRWPLRWAWRFGCGGTGRAERFLRRCWLAGFLLAIVGVLLVWFVSLCLFHLIRPANEYDWVDQVTCQHQESASSADAWELYRRGVAELSTTRMVNASLHSSGVTVLTPARVPGYEHGIPPIWPFVIDRNSHAISLFVRAASVDEMVAPQFTSALEERLDCDGTGRLLPNPRFIATFHCAGEMLRCAFYDAVAQGEAAKATAILECVLRLATQCDNAGPWTACSRIGNVFQEKAARDLCNVIIERPDLFSDAQLREMSELFKARRGFRTDDRLADQHIENLLDQMYSESGSFTSKGIEILAAHERFVGARLPERFSHWLNPPDLKQHIVSFVTLPIAAHFLPTRDELRQQLQRRREVLSGEDRCPRQDEVRRKQRLLDRTMSEPEWGDVPVFILGPWLHRPAPWATDVRLEVVPLLVAMELHRREHRGWPDSLASFENLVPIDPYADRRLRYRLEQGTPVLWSVGKDCADDGGEKLSAYPIHGYDWQLVPQADPRLKSL